MPQQIIQQPDGKWAVFSTVVDGLLIWDATEQEVEDWFVEREAKFIRQNVRQRIEQAKTKSRPGEDQITTWAEAVAIHIEKHGPLTSDDTNETPSGGSDA